MTLRTDNVPTDMSLTDGIVTLRPWQPADAEAIFAAIEESRPELQQWLPAAGGVTHVNEVRQYIAMTLEWRETRVAYDFVIADAQTGGVLGGCGLTQINRNHHFANLYYWVRCGSASWRGSPCNPTGGALWDGGGRPGPRRDCRAAREHRQLACCRKRRRRARRRSAQPADRT